MDDDFMKRTDISPIAKLVFLMVASGAAESPPTRLSIAAIADGIGCSERSVCMAVRSLRQSGLIEVKGAPGKPNQYVPTCANFAHLPMQILRTHLRKFCAPPAQILHTTCANFAHPQIDDKSSGDNVLPQSDDKTSENSPPSYSPPSLLDSNPISSSSGFTDKPSAHFSPNLFDDDSEAPDPPEKPRRPRKRDELFDAVTAAFGIQVVSRREGTRIGGVVRDLRAKGAKPADVQVRLDRFRRAWGGNAGPVSPEGLVKWWDQMATEQGAIDPAAIAREKLAALKGKGVRND